MTHLLRRDGSPEKGFWGGWISFSLLNENLLLLGLLGEKDSLDVGEDTTLGNGDSRQELVQLFVITDGELQVTGNDPGLLVISGGITSQFKDFSSQVFHNCSQVDWSSCSYTLSIVALSEKPVDTTDGELKSSPAGTGL